MPIEKTANGGPNGIAIASTDQPATGRSGLALVARFLEAVRAREVPAKVLPDGRTALLAGGALSTRSGPSEDVRSVLHGDWR